MLAKLNKLVTETNPRVLGQVLKSKIHQELFTWVLHETKILGAVSIAEQVFYLVNDRPNVICGYGEKKTLSPTKHEYGFCNNAEKCQCLREHLKATYVPRDMNAVAEKRKQTWLKKYGVDNAAKAVQVIAKRKATMSNRDYTDNQAKRAYGMQSQGFSDVITRLAPTVLPNFTREEYHGSFRKNEYSWKCVKCSHIFLNHVDYGTIPRCEKCYPKTVSKMETEIKEYIQSLGIILESNTKRLLGDLEYDMYIPSKKIAIEYNGVYWHSSLHKDKKYHVTKFIRSRDIGVHLIQIFEDEWLGKKEIVKARLKSALGLNNRIYARKCQVSTISTKQCKEFTKDNHLQGAVNATFTYGLHFAGQLVAIMSFAKSRYTKTGYELLRYCSVGNIIGGAGKLFAAFNRDHSPELIISYANRCWSNGNLYRKLGFDDVTIDDNNTGYWYIKNNIRYHRSSFTKARLVGLGANPALPEAKIMADLGYLTIHDAGNYKFQWTAKDKRKGAEAPLIVTA